MPAITRPPEMSSSVSRSLASVTGCRKFGDVTQVPRPILLVTVAAAVSVGMVPNQSCSDRSRQARWS